MQIDSDFRNLFGMNRSWVKTLLAERDFTQNALATAMGLTPPRLSETLHGRRRISLGEAKKMADFLSVTIDDVWTHAEISAK